MSDAERTPAKLAFGQLLRELRGSQEQSVFGARYGGYDRRAISAIENGVRAPKPRLLIPLLEGFPRERDRIDRAVQRIEGEERDRQLDHAAQSESTVARIRRLLRRGGVADARRALRAALHEQRTADLLELAGDLEADPAKAVERYCEALATRYLSPSAMESVRKRQFDHSIESLRKVEGYSVLDNWLDRTDTSASDLAAACYFCDAVRVTGTSPDATRLRTKIADKFWEAKQYRRALSTVSQHLTSDRTCAELWLRRGRFLWYFGDLHESYASLTTALDLGARRSAVTIFRGQIHLEWGDDKSAIDELTVGIADSVHSEEKADALAARAWAFTLNGRAEEATKDLTEAERLGRGSALVSYYGGLCKWRNGDYLEAGFAFWSALARDDRDLPYLREEQCRRIFESVFEEWKEPHEKKQAMRDTMIYSLYEATPETASPELRKRIKDALDENLARESRERVQTFRKRYLKREDADELENDEEDQQKDPNDEHEVA